MRHEYFGYSDKAEFLQMTWEELLNRCVGEIIISIGSGKFKDAVSQSLRMAGAWAIYVDDINTGKRKK